MTRQERFEVWFGGNSDAAEKKRLFEADKNGDYKFMVTRSAFNSFLAGCKSESKTINNQDNQP